MKGLDIYGNFIEHNQVNVPNFCKNMINGNISNDFKLHVMSWECFSDFTSFMGIYLLNKNKYGNILRLIF